MEGKKLIEVKDLTKKYDSKVAVSHLSFEVESGRIYGFLGPNGAGKSTTMNMIAGCLASSSGTVLIDGHDIFEEPIAAKKLIGYLPEHPPLYQDMTPEEYLRFVAGAKGIERSKIDDELETVMIETGIFDVRRRLIKHLSKGYKQRVGIAQALLGSPKLIILDEPTVGLDPKQIIEIRDLIRSLGENRTVMISSHILAEISEICDHVMIINHGRLVASDTIENIKARFADSSRILMTVKADENTASGLLESVNGVIGFEISPLEDGYLDISVKTDGSEDVREHLSAAFVKAGAGLRRITDSAPSLEEIFIKLTSDDIDYDEEDGEDSEDKEDSADTDGTDHPGDTDGLDDSDGSDDASGDGEDGAGEDDGYTPLFGGNKDDKDDGEEDL